MRSRCAGAMPAPSSATVSVACRPAVDVNPDRRSYRAVLDRVVDEIRHCVLSTSRSARDTNVRGRRDVQPLLSFLGEQAQRGGDISREVAEVDDVARQANRAGVATRELQQRIDQPREPVDLLEHRAHRLFVFRGRPGFRGPARRSRESPTSGVRNSCDASAVNRRSWSKEDSRRANVSLITAASLPISSCAFGTDNTLVQAIRGDAARFGGELIDRRQCAPRQDIPADAGQHDDDRQTEDQHDEDFAKLLFDALLGTRRDGVVRLECACLLRVARGTRAAPPGT